MKQIAIIKHMLGFRGIFDVEEQRLVSKLWPSDEISDFKMAEAP